MRAMVIVGQLVTIGGVSIVSVGVAGMCAFVSFVLLVMGHRITGGEKAEGRGSVYLLTEYFLHYVDNLSPTCRDHVIPGLATPLQ